MYQHLPGLFLFPTLSASCFWPCLVLSPVPLSPDCFCWLPFLGQGCSLHSLVAEPTAELHRAAKVAATRMHGFQSLLSSQPTSNPFLSAWSLLFPSLFSCFSFRVWYQIYCNSIRDLTWAALSLCNAFFPPFLPLPVPHLLKDYLLREASLTTQSGFSALIST